MDDSIQISNAHPSSAMDKRLALDSKRKSGKTQKSILSKKETATFKVLYQGEDLTPEVLNPLAYEGIRERQLSVYDMTGNEVNLSNTEAKMFHSQSTSRFHVELQRQTLHAETAFVQSYISSSRVDDIYIEPEKKETPSASIIFDEDQEIPDIVSEFQAPSEKMPTHISLILKETPTIFLLDLPSKTVDKNSEEAILVEEENARYEYLTVGKGRNRKMVNAEVQTFQILLKSRYTEGERIKRKHNYAFASCWEMYDTYEEEEKKEAAAAKDAFDDSINESEPSAQSLDSFMISFEDRQMALLLQNPRFLEAVCVIERLLANNNFNTQQKRFRGLSDPDPFREDIQYKYRLDLLWTFANKDTMGRCVTSMCWNEVNSDILAVGYGKFYFTDRTTGMVMLWNIKNPVQPERVYHFDEPVTAINFSVSNPNLLGVGFYDGKVNVVDVSSRDLRIITHSGPDSPSFEPIWQIVWYKGSDYFKDKEQIIAASQDGRISHYRTQDTSELIYSQIMRIPRPEGKLKGIETLRRCHVPGIPVTRYSAALVMQQHPLDRNIYYVGTSEGTVHRCSRNYYHQHLDLFLAHDGPLYEIRFSPFCKKIFLTCGDDWYVRIWVDGIAEPLFELTKTMYCVQGADWSPTHSTIVANICGNQIYIWDLQRKTYAPQSITNSPTSSRNTVIRFTQSGRCVVVGDMDGNVHIFALEDMPFPAFFQDDLLINSMIRCLVTRPDLIKKLKKLGNLNV